MSGAEHAPGEISARTDAPTADTTTTLDTTGITPVEDTTPSAGETTAPLTSLTSLLGGTFEGGTTCMTDGSCD